jgi:dienelactone hydrolase
MSDESARHEITRKPLVYAIDGADELPVRRDIDYRGSDGGGLTFDLYYPRDPAAGGPAPVVVFANGFPDAGMKRVLGCRQKEMQSYVSWARLAAASGLAAVAYANREPVADAAAVLDHLRQHGAGLAIDGDRIGLWACSGHGPLAMSLLMDNARYRFRCATLCYPLLLDLDGAAAVAAAAAQFGFVNPAAGRAVAELPPDVPLLIARAGKDEMPQLNETLDRFAAQALALDLPLTLVNLPAAPHAFDILLASDGSRAVIRQILAFLRLYLEA